MTLYRVRNLHSIPRGFTNSQGQRISFASGEEKELRSKPPRSEELWSVEIIEQTNDDIETKKPEEENDDNGGD